METRPAPGIRCSGSRLAAALLLAACAAPPHAAPPAAPHARPHAAAAPAAMSDGQPDAPPDGLPALPGKPGDAATAITADEIQGHVDVLASDLFEGREAGTRGERRAAAYIVDRLEQSPRLQPAGVDGGWFQPFPIVLHNEDATARNIVAMLPGTDPELAAQTIVVGAHYDHVGFGESGNALDGRGEIHNGADDNASGSAVLLDLATSLADAGWQPRRTILFQWYSGEELGLLGSTYWCQHPLRPLENTVFMINMDMVGRLVTNTLCVGGTGTAPGLGDLARAACARESLVMLDDPPGRAPSDNTSFYDRDVPVLFLFTGLHEDYHSATDDSPKLEAEGAARIGRMAATVLLALDARDERLPFQLAPGEALMFRPHAFTGAVFAALSDDPAGGVELAVLLPDSPAELAGLREHDIVLAVDGVPLTPPSPDAQGWQDAALAQLEARLKRLDDPLLPVTLRVLRRGSGAGSGDETLTVVLQPVVR